VKISEAVAFFPSSGCYATSNEKIYRTGSYEGTMYACVAMWHAFVAMCACEVVNPFLSWTFSLMQVCLLQCR